MKVIYIGVIGLAMLAMVTGQNDEVAEGIQRSVSHLKHDVSRYFATHKELTEHIKLGDNKCREELDEMWNLIKCIIDLHKNMSAWIKRMQDQGFSDDQISDSIGRWLQIIFEKTSRLAELADDIRDKIKDKNLLKRFDELNANCIEESTTNLLDVLEGVAARLENSVSSDAVSRVLIFPWKEPIPQICKKIREMILLCREMRRAWRDIRKHLKSKKCKLTFNKYPYKEMGLMCDCIIEFCKIIRQLHRLCLEANSPNMTPAELEKRLCQLIMKLVEVRRNLIDYYINLLNKVRGSTKSKCWSFIVKRLGGLIERMDKCIRLLQCWYQDLVNAGGPMRAKLTPVTIKPVTVGPITIRGDIVDPEVKIP